MNVESELKDLIVENYGSITAFTGKIGMANSTFATIMKKGVGSANIDNIIKICKELGISADALYEGDIVPVENAYKVNEASVLINNIKRSSSFILIDGSFLTDQEFAVFSNMLDFSIEMVRRMRKK